MTGLLFDLGVGDYKETLELQRRLAVQRASNLIPNSFVLVEHNHVITLGRKTTPSNFRAQDIPVYQVERGGDATYHGPGQLVGYPIIKLEDHDVRRLVREIEASLIESVAAFGIHGETREGHPGVWVEGKKLASVGVAVTNWVSYHGFALNVNTEMRYFELIRPCGLDPSTMTSMEKILGRRMEMGEVKAEVLRQFELASGEDYTASEPREEARARLSNSNVK